MTNSRRLHGLDLFSGIGGNSLGLREWVNTIAYCERDRYAQGVLLSRMSAGELSSAPIWDDVTTLRGGMLPGIDIIIGGFPCQDISVAGRGEGLEGKRSGLFFEIVRLAEEIRPAFIFLENVPAIRTRGLDTVVRTLSSIGYDCRWDIISAAEVGAHHKRNRWFLLAYTNGLRERQPTLSGEVKRLRAGDGSKDLADTSRTLLEGRRQSLSRLNSGPRWTPEPDVGRMAYGVPARVDRIKCLGNAVVPAQAREAFKRLMGIKEVENG